MKWLIRPTASLLTAVGAVTAIGLLASRVSFYANGGGLLTPNRVTLTGYLIENPKLI